MFDTSKSASISEGQPLGSNFDRSPCGWVGEPHRVDQYEEDGRSQLGGPGGWDNDEAVMEDMGPPADVYYIRPDL